jgi:hypothetical protein
MRTASKISSGRPARKRRQSVIANPFKTWRNRGRKREARRWLDELAARCTNAARDPKPLTFAESSRIHSEAFAHIQAHEKALANAVHECIWDDWIREKDLTLNEWQVRARRESRRIAAIRATLRS